MKKVLAIGILCSMSAFGATNEVMSTIQQVDQEYQQLLQEEAQKVEEFKLEKETLEEELAGLQERMGSKEEVFQKLQRDSEIRWHRKEYKKLAKKFDLYYAKLEAAIAEKQTKISELEKLLQILGN